MGVDTRKKPPLPAPTESSTLQTSGEDLTGTDLATDISRRTDRTSYSIPEDGSPVTISTTKKNDKDKDRGNILTRSHQSQTSLLIEYFEGGKGPNVSTRPSVRVKVTPSSAKRSKESKDHIQITEAGGHRKPSYTRRISLGPKNTDGTRATESDERSISSYASAAEDSSLAPRRPPVEIEVMHKDQVSDLSGTSVSRDIHINPSEISSMPPDSLLEGHTTVQTPRRNRSRSLTRDAAVATATAAALVTAAHLKTPSRQRSRSLSKERLTNKVIEKLGSKSRTASTEKRKSGGKSRSRSISKEQLVETVSSPKRRSSRHHHVEDSGAESSLPSTSQVSDNKRRSMDQSSFRSGTTQSSINNPKLLATVEDAIRRLILPELTALKHEQNRTKFDRDRRESYASGSSISREELTRRVSKHASAPDVSTKPKVVLNRDEHNPGTILSSDSIRRKGHRHHEQDYTSPSERSYDRGMSEETVIRDGDDKRRKRSKDSHKLRDVAVGGVVGGILTAAALKHHDSRSSVDRRERRKKRSKSHSRSTSVAESTEEIFYKHDVPPMPMRSEITESDMTRNSILSEVTSTPTSERRRAEIREVARSSPREILSPAAGTPTRSPVTRVRAADTYDSGAQHNEHNDASFSDDRGIHEGKYHSTAGEAMLAGTAAGTGLLAVNQAMEHNESTRENIYSTNKGLSPIQSVASFRESEPNRDSFRKTHSSGSLSSEAKYHRKNSTLSINSLSSAASANFARSKRPRGINLETDKEILEQHQYADSEHQHDSTDPAMDAWYESQHEENQRYRDSTGDSSFRDQHGEDDRYRDSLGNNGFRDSTINIKHLTNYTDDSMDAPYLDKITAAQHIRGIGLNPEYVHTPLAVESAVASLHDPSVLDVHSNHSSRFNERSYLDSPNDDQQDEVDRYETGRRERAANRGGSPLKAHFEDEDDYVVVHSHDGKSNVLQFDGDSPRQSVAKSLEYEDEHIPMTASGVPIADDPLPEIGHGLEDTKSEISTNPSIIQGPSGVVPPNSGTHWNYQATPPPSKGDVLTRSNDTSAHESLKTAAAMMLSAAAGAGAGAALAQREQKGQKSFEQSSARNMHSQSSLKKGLYHQELDKDLGPIQDQYLPHQKIPTPSRIADEGYISGANARYTPDNKGTGTALYDNDVESLDDFAVGEDPFTSRAHMRHLSGNSHGMPSPLYDSSTGRGIDRIQSKDVVALMDHLTVRDAQRNARDTEILVTLVRSAAEMRNSFEDMKRFIAEQDEMLIDVGSKQHERTTQRIIGGPRPLPSGTSKGVTLRASAEDDMMDDLPAKRRSVFRRALKNLGGRNSNDLARIEEMLERLLDNVEGLKIGQEGTSTRHSGMTLQKMGLDSYENLRDAPATDGYEPEGQAGTGSTGNQSGYFSNPPSRQANRARGHDGRRESQNRVSTVLEADEDPETPLETHEQDVLGNQFENNEQLLTPTREARRGGSVPLDTTPTAHVPTGTQSNEHTPKTDKSRKHKSSSSSFFPKFSRWSKTTASSAPDNRNSGRQERPMSEMSRSGSDLNYNGHDTYDPQGDDRIRSSTSLNDRPPSPLIPSQVSEKPAYHAHRDSLNLQHPQPRPGPTARYQNHLEYQAQTLGSPISPTSDQFGSNPILARYAPGSGNNGKSSGPGNLSPISDAGHSELSAVQHSNAPPRPPKIRDDGPLVPQRPPKENLTFAERSTPSTAVQNYLNPSDTYDQANGSPLSASGHPQQRKPTGPRPIVSSGSYSPGMISQVKKTRYRGSPNHIESSSEDVTF